MTKASSSARSTRHSPHWLRKYHHAEASYKVWENGCKTLQTFTQAEVVST
jgi:hypothetical protein